MSGGERPSEASRRAPSLGAAYTDLSQYGAEITYGDLIERRRRSLGANLLFYHDPVHLVRAEGVWMFDREGRRYLDCYNNVPSVGHCNPRVVDALCEQARRLNTHTRYLDETVVEYAERLLATLPDELDRCAFTCTGTEANELAMRIARTVTGKRGAVVMEYSYHGNSTLISELSTAGVPADHRAPHVAAVEPPNLHRGPFRLDHDAPGAAYAELVRAAADQLEERGEGLAAFLCDAIFDSQGGLEAPADYFEHAYRIARERGALCIADEVQAGFARTGTMWGFAQYGVVPDIVTFGKPAGNGHPVAGLATTRAIMERFGQRAFYFNTFGGNPVSAAVGLAVLDEIRDRDLCRHVAEVGAHLRRGLERLAERHPAIDNVRGRGLYQGVELVRDREDREPAVALARQIPDAMKTEGVLIGISGRYGNVLKVRPPLVFEREHADQLVETLDRVLARLTS